MILTNHPDQLKEEVSVKIPLNGLLEKTGKKKKKRIAKKEAPQKTNATITRTQRYK